MSSPPVFSAAPRPIRAAIRHWVLNLLSQVRLSVPAATLSRDLFLLAGTALLGHAPRRQRRAQLAAHALCSVAPVFRSALRDGIASRACRRMDRDFAELSHWP